MAEVQKYWFSRRRGTRASFPISWEGWALSLGEFLALIFAVRELEGPIRVVVIIALIGGFWLLADRKTLEYGA